MKKITPPFVRNPYNYDTNDAGDESGIQCDPAGAAKQSFKDEVDINTIVKRFGIGYEMPPNPKVPEYGDYTNIPTFHQAMNLTVEARENFELLPAHVRAKFNHDTVAYVDFCLNPENREEMKKLGLLSADALQRDQEVADKALRAQEASDKADAIKRAKRENSASGGSRGQKDDPESE